MGTANVDQAKGNFESDRQSYIIGANDQILQASGYRPGEERSPPVAVTYRSWTIDCFVPA